MAIEIVCDDCGNKYRVSDDKAGSKVRCRECGSRIEVPSGDDDLFDAESATRPRAGKRRKKGSSGPPTGVIIGLGAVVGVVIIGVVLFSTLRGGGQQVAQNGPAPLPNSGPAPVGPAPAQTNFSPAPANVPPGVNQAQPASTLPKSAGTGNLPASNLPKSNPAATLPGQNDAAQAPNVAANALPGGQKFGGFVNGDAEPEVAAEPGGPPDVPLPDNWTVKVDPPKVDTKIDAKSISLKFPKNASSTDILYPASPSVFVALGANGGSCQIREVWNLATKAKVGTITGDFAFGWPVPALSPDGQHFAITLQRGKKGVGVWVCKTGKALGELETEANISNVLFAGTIHLIGFSEGTAKVWKLPSGDQEFELAIDKGNEPNAAAPSPGGNYLAVLTEKTSLKIFDLTNGEVCGELSIPLKDVHGFHKPEAISFSPDGTKLGMILPTSGFDRTFAMYNVADGKLLALTPLNVKDIWGGPDPALGNRLEWFPDNSRLLWRGHHILDAKIGGPVWSAPKQDGSDAPRKLISADKILVVGGGRRDAVLRSDTVPIAEIGEAANIVAKGGERSDAGLPPIMKAEAAGAAPLALTAGNAWTMKPDGAPEAVKVKNGLTIPKERASLGGVYISRPHVGRAVLWSSDGANNLNSPKPAMIRPGILPSKGQGTVDIDVFNLTTGKILATVPITHPCSVLDVGPNGDCVIVRTSKPNAERVDVYELPSGKPIAGWRPHQDQHTAFRDVKHAVLLDGEYCMTQAGSGPIQSHGPAYMWKLPECQAVWRLESGGGFSISPGGKYLGIGTSTHYFFIEARTGTVVGEVPLMYPKAQCAFHPTGSHIAILNADEVSHHISIIDVETGKPTAEFFVPHGSDWVQWCGDTNLLLDDKWLVDLKQQKYAWQYELPSVPQNNLPLGTHAITQLDGRHWYLASTRFGDPNVSLTGAAIPEPAVQMKIDETAIPDESLMKPGMQFGLQANLAAGSSDHPNLQAEVLNNFKAGLERNGYAVAPNSPYTFVISTAQSNPGGDPMVFGNRGDPFNPEVSVPVFNVSCEVALLFNGQAVWKNTKVMSNRTFMVFIKRGEDIATHLSKQTWGGVANHLTKFPVPKQVFGTTAEAGLGKSIFAPGGTQPSR